MRPRGLICSEMTGAKKPGDQPGDNQHQACKREDVVEPLHLRPNEGWPLVGKFVRKRFSKPWGQSGFFRLGLPVVCDPGSAKIRQQQGDDNNLDHPYARRIEQDEDERRKKVSHVTEQYDRRSEGIVLANSNPAEMKQ